MPCAALCREEIILYDHSPKTHRAKRSPMRLLGTRQTLEGGVFICGGGRLGAHASQPGDDWGETWLSPKRHHTHQILNDYLDYT